MSSPKKMKLDTENTCDEREDILEKKYITQICNTRMNPNVLANIIISENKVKR